MPERAHESDAGYDLFARESRIIKAGGSAVFDTGVHIAIPHGHCGLLVSKSGLNTHSGIVSTGLIDSDYTGSIRVKLYNHGEQEYPIMEGDKISQLVILPIITPELTKVASLGNTERGEKGFGSTGR
jgi:dUTP pyrophosphatase